MQYTVNGPLKLIRTYLKKVFWLNLCVGRSVQILEIQQYFSGSNLSPALTLSQNPIFEIGSMVHPQTASFVGEH